MTMISYNTGLDHNGSVVDTRQKTYSLFYEWSSLHEKAIEIPSENGVKAKFIRIVPNLAAFSYTDDTSSGTDSLDDSNGGGAIGSQTLISGDTIIKLTSDSTHLHLKNLTVSQCVANIEFYI